MSVVDGPDIGTATALLVFASLAAVHARAVRGVARPQLEAACQRRGRPELYAEITARSETIAFVAATAVVVASVAATLLACHRAASALPDGRAWVVLVGWTFLAWVLLVVVPMLVVAFAGAWIVVTTWQFWRPVVRLCGPVVGRLSGVAAALAALPGRRVGGGSGRPRDELRLAVEEAHREGRLEGEARDMIRGVIALDEVRVAKVMTPRTSIVAIPAASPWEEVVRIAADSGHTRLPVWSGTPDEVIGILHTRDLFGVLAEALNPDAAPPALRPLLRPPWFVPESMSVQTLLREFRRGNTHMAIVTDEFGGVSGLVTIEDALEEIVGEIADEHDEAFADGIRTLSEHTSEVLAHVPLVEVNRRLGVSLPEENAFATLGGFVFHQFGRIPDIGETIDTHGVRLEVLAATRRRIDLVRVERLAPAPAGDGADDGD